MYKIYINENPLILCETRDPIVNNKIYQDDLILPYRGRQKALFQYLDYLEKSTRPASVVIHTKELKPLWKAVKGMYISITAGGGLVVNEKNEMLLIYRRGYWDLPKGKKELDESKKQSAIREVKEETGIKNVQIENKLMKGYHSFRIRGQRALKITHWYLMRSNDINLKPQKKEGIEQLRWISLEEWPDYQKRSFKNIGDVIAAFADNQGFTLGTH